MPLDDSIITPSLLSRVPTELAMANNHGNFDFDLATSNGVQVAIGLLSSLSSVMPHEKDSLCTSLHIAQTAQTVISTSTHMRTCECSRSRNSDQPEVRKSCLTHLVVLQRPESQLSDWFR